MLLPYPVHLSNCCSMRNLCEDTALLVCPRIVNIECPGQRIYPRHSNSTQQFHTALLQLVTSFRSACNATFPPVSFRLFFRTMDFRSPNRNVVMDFRVLPSLAIPQHPNQDAEPSGTGISISGPMTGYAEMSKIPMLGSPGGTVAR
jgi:hypothetical protein